MVCVAFVGGVRGRGYCIWPQVCRGKRVLLKYYSNNDDSDPLQSRIVHEATYVDIP